MGGRLGGTGGQAGPWASGQAGPWVSGAGPLRWG